MNTAILTAEIHREDDLVFIRRRARHIAAFLGLSTQDQTRVATAVSELSRNAFRYAGSGRVCFELRGQFPEMLLVRIHDDGPGINDLDEVLGGTYISPGGMGRGILGARRLMDYFDIDSEPGRGTTIILGKSLPDSHPATQGKSSAEVAAAIAQKLTTLVATSPVREMQDQNQALLHALSDAQEAQRARDELIENLRRTVRLNELFVGVLGHDLRNPLTAVIMNTSLLQHGVQNEVVQRTADRIMVSAERMNRLIGELLDVTQIRLGAGLPLQRRDVDLGEVTQEIVDEFQLNPHADDPHRAPLEIRYEYRGDLCGDWDPDRLSQVLSNLLGNAQKHGDPEAPIRLYLDGDDPDHVQMLINNRGKIPPDILPHIFEPLRSSDGSATSSRHLGLGLYITEQIIIAHGGQIVVTSDDAQGTSFLIMLPRYGSTVGSEKPVGLEEISWIAEDD